MGIDVVVEDDAGNIANQAHDPTNAFHKVLPSPEDTSFHCLNCIDPYGDTIFNRLQMPGLREELARISEKVSDRDMRSFIEKIIELTKRVEADVHLYMKFIGD